MSRYLVTGASGFIGRALTGHLGAFGNAIVGIGSVRGDIADPGTLEPFREEVFDRVFHLAARTYVPDSWEHPSEFVRVNLGGTVNVLEFCRTRLTPLTYVSAYVYGQPQTQPICEEHPLAPNNPYALSKVLAEQACEFYARVHSVPVAIVRPFNVYGPGQSPRFLVPSILRQVLHEEAVEVQDLEPRRDYLHLDDLIRLIAVTDKVSVGLRTYNAGTGMSSSVAEVIAAAQSEAGTSKRVVSHSSSRAQEIPDTRADVSRARHELGWTPRVTLNAGLRDMLSQMKASS